MINIQSIAVTMGIVRSARDAVHRQNDNKLDLTFIACGKSGRQRLYILTGQLDKFEIIIIV